MSSLGYKDIVGGSVKSLPTVEVNDSHYSALIHKSCCFIVEINLVDQAPLSLGQPQAGCSWTTTISISKTTVCLTGSQPRQSRGRPAGPAMLRYAVQLHGAHRRCLREAGAPDWAWPRPGALEVVLRNCCPHSGCSDLSRCVIESFRLKKTLKIIASLQAPFLPQVAWVGGWLDLPASLPSSQLGCPPAPVNKRLTAAQFGE